MWGEALLHPIDRAAEQPFFITPVCDARPTALTAPAMLQRIVRPVHRDGCIDTLFCRDLTRRFDDSAHNSRNPMRVGDLVALAAARAVEVHESGLDVGHGQFAVQ